MEREALEQQGQVLVRQAQALVVVDAVTFAAAAEKRKLLKTFIKQAHTVLDPFVDAGHKAWKQAFALRAQIIDPPETADKTLKTSMEVWQAEVERQQREAEEAIQREQERLEREAQRIADEEAARLRREAEDAAIAAAAEAEAQGDTETAERILEAPVYVPTVTPMPVFTPPTMTVPQMPKVDGVSFSNHRSAKLVSLDNVIAAAAQGHPMAKACLMFNQKAANKLSESILTDSPIPGVRFLGRKIAAIRV